MSFSMGQCAVVRNWNVMDTVNCEIAHYDLNSQSSICFNYISGTCDFDFENLYDVPIIDDLLAKTSGTWNFNFEICMMCPLWIISLQKALLQPVVGEEEMVFKIDVQFCTTLA